MENTSINLVPQCENCGNVLDNLTMTYKMDSTGKQTIFDPQTCPNCGKEIWMISWPKIPLYADSKDGASVVIR